jgi:hypothetical protein
VNDWNEWKTQKRHASTNMEKLRTTRIMMATVRYVASGVGLRQFQAAWFLFHRAYTRIAQNFQSSILCYCEVDMFYDCDLPALGIPPQSFLLGVFSTV